MAFALDAECLLRVRARVEDTTLDREVALATSQTPDEALEALGQERVRGAPARPTRAEAAPTRPALRHAMPAPQSASRAATPSLFGRLFGWLRRS